MAEATAPSDQATPRWCRLRRWLAVWLVLTVAFSALHMIVWMSADAAATGTVPASWTMKLAANFVHALTGPGWLLLNATTYLWGYHSPVLTVVAIGSGLAIEMYALSVLLRLRRRVVGSTRGKPAPDAPDLSRRRLVVDGVIAAAGVVGVGAIVKGTGFEPWDLTVRRYSIPVEDLPPSLAGMRIVQISDTHLGPRIPAEYVRHALDMALSLKPDLFVLTGDYVHAGVEYIEPAAALFSPLTERRLVTPVLGTLGNHDWYNDGEGMRRALRRVGVRMIDNGRVFLDADTREMVPTAPKQGLCIAGLGDLLEDWIDIDTAVQGVAPDMPRVVLSHNPDSAEQKSLKRERGPRVDLMLSGHTHGGQVRIPGAGTPFIPSRFGQKYAGGLCQGPRFRVLVSRGVGMSIFPVRLGVPPELVEIMLTRA